MAIFKSQEVIVKQENQNHDRDKYQDEQEVMLSKINKNSVNKNLILSIKDFGALGDGISDDTQSIQATINAVNQLGGGIVYIPEGIYKVSINFSNQTALSIYQKITLQGVGDRASIIKLTDNQGNYDSILAGERDDANISDFAMYDLAIDGNGLNNPVSQEQDLVPGKLRHSLRIYIGSNIKIERCRFINQSNINTITLNGNTAPFNVSISDVSINNNIFEDIGGGDIDYDHSTVYTHGENIQISENYFSSRNGAGTPGARTAIEIHGDKHTVTNNYITGFTNGINVTGYASSSDNQSITDNIIKEAYAGIVIWSYFSDGRQNTSNPAISNCMIAHNHISLNTYNWHKLWGDIPTGGIVLEPRSDAPIENLEIVGNQVFFTKSYKSQGDSDNLGNGIRLWRSENPSILSKNIQIKNNTIYNALSSGIHINMPIKKGEIYENKIFNPGRSKSKFHDYYRAGIFLDGNLDKMNIQGNSFIDNQVSNTLKVGIIDFAICNQNCSIADNYLRVDSGAKVKLFHQQN
ncbi:MAG: glycosyl hydrolase family 28-related protein [Cyanobacteria bacterium P01_A01_bin.84]